MAKLTDIFSSYEKAVQRNELSTMEVYLRSWNYLIAAIGDIDIVELDYRQVEQYQSWLVRSGKSKASVNSYVKNASAIVGWAVMQDWIKQNPFVRLKRFKVAKKRIRLYSESEIELILMNCPNLIWQSRIMLAYYAGLRRGEVLNLQVSDIDFERCLLYVAHHEETANGWRHSLKAHELGVLPAIARLLKMLTNLALNLPDGQPYLTLTPQRYRRIMHLKRAGTLSDRIRKCPDENFRQPFLRILRHAGVKHGTFHDLRRTFATNLIERGMPLNEAVKLTRHASTKVLEESYMGIRDGYLSRARQLLSVGATGLEPATS